MAFVTTVRLQSGDRAALDRVVEEIRSTAAQKGAELTGPHRFPPERYTVPLYGTIDRPEPVDTWDYTVYRRELELVGHEHLARAIVGWDFPPAVRLEVTVNQAPA